MKGRVAALAMLGALVGACGATTEPSRLPDPGLLAKPLAYRCDDLVFDPALFDRPGDAESAGTQQAEFLREWIVQSNRGSEPLPAVGWHLIEQRPDGADFLAHDDSGASGDQSLIVTTIQLNVSYARRASSNRCRPEAVLPADLATAAWVLDPAFGAAKPNSTTIHALVSGRECTGGKSPTDRLVGPAVVADATSIRILFALTPLPAGTYTCQGYGGAPATVDLGMPIGGRTLIDPSTWPNPTFEVGP